jgi:beta-glucosidase
MVIKGRLRTITRHPNSLEKYNRKYTSLTDEEQNNDVIQATLPEFGTGLYTTFIYSNLKLISQK